MRSRRCVAPNNGLVTWLDGTLGNIHWMGNQVHPLYTERWIKYALCTPNGDSSTPIVHRTVNQVSPLYTERWIKSDLYTPNGESSTPIVHQTVNQVRFVHWTVNQVCPLYTVRWIKYATWIPNGESSTPIDESVFLKSVRFRGLIVDVAVSYNLD